MSKWNKILLIVATIGCFFTLLLGVWLFWFSDHYFENNYTQPSSIISIDEGWYYTTDKSDLPVKVTLPAKLVVDEDVRTITLRGRLPQTPIYGGVLRFNVSTEEIEISIGRVMRKTYGDVNASDYDYTYLNAPHIMSVNLMPQDYGKELTINLKASDAFSSSLSMVRSVEVGSRGDFIISYLFSSAFTLIITALAFSVIIMLLCVALAMRIRKQSSLILVAMAFFTLLWALFYNSNSDLLLEIYNFSERFSAINEWKYYVFDAFMPLLSLGLLLQMVSKKLPRWENIIIGGQILLYISALVLHCLGIISINYYRPWLMAYAFINTIIVVIIIFRTVFVGVRRFFSIGILALLGGYFLDYIKYAVSLLESSSSLFKFIQIHVSSTFFLSIGILIYCLCVLFGIVEIFLTEQRRLQRVSKTDSLTGVYNRVALREHFDVMINDDKAEKYVFLMVDIDDFKAVNDTYGHSFGDIVLENLGASLKHNSADATAFRFGGDEFCMLFRGLSIEEVKLAFEEVQADFRRKMAGLSQNNLITISGGASAYSQDMTPAELLNHADKALYHSKSENRGGFSSYAE